MGYLTSADQSDRVEYFDQYFRDDWLCRKAFGLHKQEMVVTPVLNLENLNFHKWANLPEVKRGVCGSALSSKWVLIQHVETTHRMTKKEYCQQYGEIDASLTDAECKLCNRTLTDIRKHVRRYHGTKPHHYFLQHVMRKTFKLSELENI